MEIHLQGNETLVIDRPPRSLRVVCHRGAFWLTQSGDPRDYPLTPGHAVTPAGSGRLVLWALRDGAVTITAPQQVATTTPLQVQLHAR